LTLGSLFDGIGGFPLAAVRNGILPLWASEIEQAPISITKRHFPAMRHLGDIKKINGGEIEPVDIITFGSPCQDLSISGRRAGLDGKRSGLFLQAVRVIKEMRIATKNTCPARIIWENVPGAFSAHKGRDFQTVIQEIAGIAKQGISIPRPSAKIGWLAAGAVMGDSWSLAWRVMDAQYWGLPQRRRRIYLVADFASRCAGEILFKQEGKTGNIEKGKNEGKGITGNAENGVRVAGFNGWRSIAGSLEYKEDSAPCIQATMPPNVVTQFNVDKGIDQYTVDIGYSTDRIQMNAQSSVTLRANSGGSGANTGLYFLPVTYCIVGNSIDRTHKSGGNGTGVSEEISYTLNTMDRHAVFTSYQNNIGSLCARDSKGIGNQYIDEDKCICTSKYDVRRLTPLECERLQGFPDGWTEYGYDGKLISDNQRYKALGNSVALPCVEFVLSGC
jgi:DNA (cytosine-5)-methyltransferase 1